MAFGSLKGTLSANGTPVAASNAIVGSVAVSVGDLIFVVFTEYSGTLATGCSDNLGNTYTAQNAGTAVSTISSRAFWSRVTMAGTLTTVMVTSATSSNPWAGSVAVINGPIKASIDANPANVTDSTTPFTCPATGTLSQVDEVVISWIASSNSTLTATAPNLLALQKTHPGYITNAIGYQLVSATASVTPAWTASGSLVNAHEGTASFKYEVAAVLAATDSLDTTAHAGNVAWNATLAAFDLNDTAAFSVSSITGVSTFAATDAVDTAAFSGSLVTLANTFTAFDSIDTVALVASVTWVIYDSASFEGHVGPAIVLEMDEDPYAPPTGVFSKHGHKWRYDVDAHTLVGNAAVERKEAQGIVLAPPLSLDADRVLRLNQTEFIATIKLQIAELQATVISLQSQVTAEVVARAAGAVASTSAIAAEATARDTAIAAEAAIRAAADATLQPIPTSSTDYRIGTVMFCQSLAVVANNATIAGTSLRTVFGALVQWANSYDDSVALRINTPIYVLGQGGGSTPHFHMANGIALAGTWKNISGVSVAIQGGGVFVRTA